MKKGFSTLFVIAIIIVVVVCLVGFFVYKYFAAQKNNTAPVYQSREVVGGDCAYFYIDGNCTITSIIQTSESISQKSSAGYEGFDVEFTFSPASSSAIPKNLNGILISQKPLHSLQLVNSWYPGALYLKKYNIKNNSIFNCQELVITKGTCTPIIFEFSKIDLTDYFETKS